VRLPRTGRSDPVEPEEDQGEAWEEPRIWAVVEPEAAPAWFPPSADERQE
jgi:hypothetical protein